MSPNPLVVTPELFGEWLVEDQLAYLEKNLTSGNLGQLWLLCSQGMDSGPVVHLCALSVARGLSIQGDWLLGLRPSILAAVLVVDGLAASVEEGWSQSELVDLVSFCLLDRYLRRQAPQRWETRVGEVEAQAEVLLVDGSLPSEGLLMRLQGQQQRALASRHPLAWQGWNEAWRNTARAAIRILAQRPRDVSQANAERLLSQQVYTDPGHFLLELLQNADDAEASEFSVEFASDQLTVRHNGAPFDFRDLVGILSIGQTTKKSTQIGYFGVGFKSVYEVTDRPRLYSGHFAFEIADISVPRALAPPAEVGEQTVLVLPLRPGLDGHQYWQKALEIEPALLLNLPHLRRLVWQDDEVVETSLCQAEADLAVLRHRQVESRYLLWSGTYRHQGQRPSGKPAQAEVHLAIPTDGQSPGTSLYSFLPISEDSGLSFIVGSHFDVPVDRERLDVNSLWNRGVLAAIPEIVADHMARDLARGWSLLAMMPLPEDALGPLFQDLPGGLVDRFSELPLLPGGRRAAEVRLLDQGLEPLFVLSEEPLLFSPDDGRRRRWLQLLGAAPYGFSELLEQLGEGRMPGRLGQRALGDWSLLHGLLMGVSDLGDAPVFLDSELHPVARAMVLDQPWRELFLNPPRSIHPGLLEFPDSSALVAKLGLPRFDWVDLLGELRDNGLANVSPEKLFERLMEAPRGVTLACLELPLFLDQHGRPGPLVPNAAYHVGVVAAAPDLPIGLLPQARFLLSSSPLDQLLDTLRWPRFDLPALVEALEWESLSPVQADHLLSCIEDQQVEWTGQSLERLAGLSIFEASSGQRLPLSQLWRYEDQGLALLLPDRQQLAQGSVSAKVVEALGLQHRLSRADLDCLLNALPGAHPETALEFLASRASRLSRGQVERIFSLPMFNGQPLAWPDQNGGPKAAKPEYVEIFSSLGQQVLDRFLVEALLPLLKACAYPLLGLTQLVEALEVAPPAPELLPLLHETFLAEAAGLQLAFSKEVRQSLPVWLSRSGRVLPSLDVPPNRELAALTGREDDLRAQSEPRLEELFPLLDGDSYLRRVLFREAKVGQPLAAQPDWCDSVAKVDVVADHLPLAYLMVSAQEILCDRALNHASPLAYPWLSRSRLASELVHPDSSVEQTRDCAPLDAQLVLETFFPLRNEPAMRKAFYAYLLSHLGTVASQPDARSFLLEVALWRSAGGHWKSLDELILDPEMPDLGGDWSPHPEIPSELLIALEAVLGVGRPDPLALLGEHLLPAYLQRPAARASILEVMARTARGVENSKLRRTLRANGTGSFPLPDGSDLLDAYHPPEDLAELPGLAVAPSEQLGFLRRLGLRYLPSADSLLGLRLTFADGQALLRLVEWAWQQQPEQLEPLWDTLTELAWLPCHDGSLKLPRQLFVRTPEIEELVGSSPELFVQHRLVVGLARRLGLKEESELDAQLVLRHLRHQVSLAQRVSGRLYSYLEDCLRSARVGPFYLAEQLKGVPWVWSDEGEYRLPTHVLAVPAFRFFGPHRGTWEGAFERYPRLAELFKIPTSVNEQVVLGFLREVHQSADLQPSRRLLRTCLTLLGDREVDLPRDWRVLPASEAASDQPVLVAASQVGLVRSNSPTLSSLFAQAGRLLVVDPGDSETAQSLEKLYQRLGIPRLRDAYTVRPDRSSRELGPEIAHEVVAFRVLLRNLAAVLPRLRAARPEWEQGEWLVESRLSHFMTSGVIRVLQDLRLTYELPQVATVAVEAAAAFDPFNSELLVGAPAIANPGGHAVVLAEGLLDLMYQGPGSEGLVDLLNLLIPLGQRDAMDSYLDRRHFPRPADSTRVYGLRERVGEILDYGLHKTLERRFPEMVGRDWSCWRRADLELPDSPEAAARALLRALGEHQPHSELLGAVVVMLSAARLEDVVAPQWAQDGRSQIALSSGGGPISPAAVAPTAPVNLATVARPAPGTQPPSGLVGVGQKVLGRLGQWLGVAPTHTMDVLEVRTTRVCDVAESYRHPPARHLLVSSKALTGHDLYCLAFVGVDFEPHRQRYLPATLPWNDSFVASGRTLELSGRLSKPDQVLPMPMYSRLVRPPAVRGGRGTLHGPDKLGLHRLSTDNPEAEIAYSVELCAAPDLGCDGSVEALDPRLVKPTAPLSALPALVVDWISWARASGLSNWELTQRARDFVVAHYAYDLSFMDNEPMLELAQRPSKGDENRLLTLLHAGAGGRYLGRGVCLELAAVLLEILRRARVPAVLAGVWMLDEGLIHASDHVVVLVLLPSTRGPVWFPIEASVNRLVRSEPQQELSREDLLQAAADVVLGPAFVAPLDARERAQAQEKAMLAVLGAARRLEVLLECFARSGRYLREIDAELQWLAARGYLTVDREELYRVAPVAVGRRRES